MRFCYGMALVPALVLLCGCGSSPPPIVEAEGVVTLNGQPLPKAKVQFVPQIDNSSAYIARGVTDDNGHFTLTCHGQAGASTGVNVVTVADEDTPAELTNPSNRTEFAAYRAGLKNRPIPPDYLSPTTSSVKVTVAAGQKDYKIELTR